MCVPKCMFGPLCQRMQRWLGFPWVICCGRKDCGCFFCLSQVRKHSLGTFPRFSLVCIAPLFSDTVSVHSPPHFAGDNVHAPESLCAPMLATSPFAPGQPLRPGKLHSWSGGFVAALWKLLCLVRRWRCSPRPSAELAGSVKDPTKPLLEPLV